MKRFALLIGLLTVSTQVFSDQWVNGYTRQNGTHVDGYHRTSPDSNPYNNYSSPGNTNPYTGAVGGYQPHEYQNNQSFGGNSQPLGGYSQPIGGGFR